jgi:hypothetical protein
VKECSVNERDHTSLGRPEGKRPLGRLNAASCIILKWIMKGYNGAYGLDLSGSG